MEHHEYETVSEAVRGLRERGYRIDFNLGKESLDCYLTPLSLRADEFEIAEVYRFEGNSDPADEAVVYAIEGKHGQKGILVNGFGPSSEAVGDELVQKLKVRH
jgi:hypothetical protein